MERLPSLNALRAFERVARVGSVRGAAEQLHVTPSAISHQLTRLEEELGVVLLQRSAKAVTLTQEGQAFFQELREAFDLLSEATARLRNRRGRNVVTITALPVFAIKWLVRRLADFHVRHPDVEVRLSTSYKTQDLAAGGYDLGIRWGSGAWPGLTAHPLMGDVVQPVCSPRFADRHGLRVPGAPMPTDRLIHMGPSREDWSTWFDLHPDMPRPMTAGSVFNEPTSAIQAAIDGLGIALGPRVLVDDDLDSGRLVPAHPHRTLLRDAYYLVHPSRAGLSAAGRRFGDWLTEACSNFSEGSLAAEVCLLRGTPIRTSPTTGNPDLRSY